MCSIIYNYMNVDNCVCLIIHSLLDPLIMHGIVYTIRSGSLCTVVNQRTLENMRNCGAMILYYSLLDNSWKKRSHCNFMAAPGFLGFQKLVNNIR